MNDQALPSSTKTQVRLHLFQNGSWGANWCFAKDFRIGRDVACELFLNSDRVSRVHAEVICENGHWWVRDLGSRNGTFLNGGKIERARLGNPSTLQVAWGGPVLQITLERVKDEPDTFINDTHTPMSDGQPAGHLEDTFTRRKAFAPPRTPPEDSSPENQTVYVAQEMYQGHRFLLPLPEGWQDRTIYVLTGPVTDGIQHNVTINVDPDVTIASLLDYVDWQLRTLAAELKGYRLLKKDEVMLNNGIPAYRVIYRWQPAKERRLYQEQLYVLHKETGYKLTTTFSKKTRKTLGPSIERMMLQFTPTAL